MGTYCLQLKLLIEDPEGRIPCRPAKMGDAGLDLCNATGTQVVVPPYGSQQVPAGIAVKVPEGYVGIIKARSSAFVKKGIFVVEGVIDSGYVGPLFVIAWNPCLNNRVQPVIIEPWERIAQLILFPVMSPMAKVVKELPETQRGETGFGSTGS
jgi:dUTP pyrophosphatase